MKAESEAGERRWQAKGRQGCPAAPEARRGEEGLSLSVPRSSQPCRRRDLRLLPPGPQDSKLLLFQATKCLEISYRSPRNQTH